MTRELWEVIPKPWQEHLKECREELTHISSFLNAAVARGDVVVPAWEKIFAALTIDPQEVKVIILGQDPYPNAKHGIGLAFAVPNESKPLPGSLRNIFSECESDLGQPPLATPDLAHWVSQGVLLLNTSLTTISGASNSHAHLPWDKVVAAILKAVVANNPDVIAILWGKAAQSFVPDFASNRVITSAHPSPLSAYRGFFGSRPFTRANEMLGLQQVKGINW